MKKCLMFPPETRCLPLSGLPLIFLNITTVQLQWSNLEMEHKLIIFFTNTTAKNCLHLFTCKNWNQSYVYLSNTFKSLFHSSDYPRFLLQSHDWQAQPSDVLHPPMGGVHVTWASGLPLSIHGQNQNKFNICQLTVGYIFEKKILGNNETSLRSNQYLFQC